MKPVITLNADEGISGALPSGIVAGDAHGLAGISYRQLDHWARQGWVTPSVDAGEGRSGRRRYSADDVVRLDLLRHLAVSRVNPAVAGPRVGGWGAPPGHDRTAWGPVAAQAAVEAGGAWVVYNPAPLRERLAGAAPVAAPGPARTTSGACAERRTA